MSLFKMIQVSSTKVKAAWIRILVLPSIDRLRFYSTYKGRERISNRNSAFLACALVSGSALSYSLFKSKENKFPSLSDVFNFFVPTVSAKTIVPTDVSNNRNKYNFIADVVDICAPAVVYIEIKDPKRIDLFTGKPTTYNNGSGFIIHEDGLVLTNAHVVMKRPNSLVRVRLLDGTTYNGIVEDVDLQGDLATVRIDKKNLPVMKLGSSSNLRPGEFVVAIGSPLSLSNTITSGVVSSANRPSEELGIHHTQIGYIQTDAAITFGNSGGPLVNLDGEAIGINAMKVTPGISFAIPIDYAKEFLKKTENKRKGNVTPIGQYDEPEKKRFLGITMITLTPEILSDWQRLTGNMSSYVKHGVLIWKVISWSPAYVAGLKIGDIITHVNGKAVISTANIYEILQKSGPIDLTVVRSGQVLHFKITPEDLN